MTEIAIIPYKNKQDEVYFSRLFRVRQQYTFHPVFNSYVL